MKGEGNIVQAFEIVQRLFSGSDWLAHEDSQAALH